MMNDEITTTNLNEKPLKKEDYEEPCCPLKMHNTGEFISTDRVISKLDEYLDKKDFVGAENHLKYWLAEAEYLGDMKGKLTVLNEQVGFYRKTEKKSEGISACTSALHLAKQLGIDNSVVMGTTLINCATAYKSFDMAETALPLYEKAQIIYEKLLKTDDYRLGGLYNNMALTVAALGDFDRAERLFDKAISIMSTIKNGAIEVAITYCNKADLYAQKFGLEQAETLIENSLEKAIDNLDALGIERDGYYAFVCEKCAPTFGYYGYFAYQNELERRAKEFYEGT